MAGIGDGDGITNKAITIITTIGEEAASKMLDGAAGEEDGSFEVLLSFSTSRRNSCSQRLLPKFAFSYWSSSYRLNALST